MSELTLDTAIKHCLDVAEQNEISAMTYKNCKEIKANMYEKLTAEKAENDCRECATDHRQLAEWLTELKEAKRLLKTVVEFRNSGYCTKNCSECVASPCDYIDWFKNMYDNEIEKLIGDELSGV